MEILGIKVDNVTFQEALEKAKKLIDSGEKHYIVTPNPEIVVKARGDPQFKKILNRASSAIPDGVGLLLGARILGSKLSERATGTDLLEGLAALAAEHGFSLFLLGGGEGVAKRAAEKLKIKNEKLKIVGVGEGPQLGSDGKPKDNSDAVWEKKVVEKINQVAPDILAVAFGAPKQEKWIARNLPKLNVKLAIGVGGALDYISGEKSRAPIWVQKVGLEWLSRLISEPKRFKRQIALPYFTYLIFRERFKK